MPDYHETAVQVEARQITNSNHATIVNWIRDDEHDASFDDGQLALITRGSSEYAYVGDWIVRHESGDFTVHPAGTFADDYTLTP